MNPTSIHKARASYPGVREKASGFSIVSYNKINIT